MCTTWATWEVRARGKPSVLAHCTHTILRSSPDARGGIRQRHRDHSEDVLETIAVPDEAARPQGLPGAAPDPGGAEAADAGLLSDHVVAESRYRRARGERSSIHTRARARAWLIRVGVFRLKRARDKRAL